VVQAKHVAESTQQVQPPDPAPAPQITKPTIPQHTMQNTVPNSSRPIALQVQHQAPKAHKREKSRGRMSRSKDKPDRECIVM